LKDEDAYSILNLSKNASMQEIRERYYILSKIFHPDKQSANLYNEAKE